MKSRTQVPNANSFSFVQVVRKQDDDEERVDCLTRLSNGITWLFISLIELASLPLRLLSWCARGLTRNASCTALLAAIFDFMQVLLATTDIVSDTLIAVQFYQEGRMGFFWVCVGILLIAQIAFTTFFVLAYGDTNSMCKQAVLWICVFPFAQLVPLLTWLQTFRFRWLDAILEFFDLRLDPFAHNYYRTRNDEDRDPLDE